MTVGKLLRKKDALFGENIIGIDWESNDFVEDHIKKESFTNLSSDDK